MATGPRVIPALMEALAEAREKAGKEYRHVRNFTPTSERMLRRYEGKENYPAGADLDDLVAAYAAALGEKVSVFDLWDEALTRARSAAQPTAGEKPGPSAREAARKVADRRAKRRGRASSG